MERKDLWKWIILGVAIACSLALVYPPSEKIRLGLDLQGGTSFVVQIDHEGVAALLRDENKDATEAQIQAKVPDRVYEARDRALEVIRNRVDNLGIAEPVIYPEKRDRIVVQLPGVDEKKREEAVRAIQSAAFLEFRLVHQDNDKLVEELLSRGQTPDGYTIVNLEQKGRKRPFFKRDKSAVEAFQTPEARAKLAQFHAPAGYELMMERESVGEQVVYTPCFVDRRKQLAGDTLVNAAVDYRALGQAIVKIEFDPAGSRRFSTITSDYAPGGARNPNPDRLRALAILLDNTLYSAPVIKEAIHGGRAEISGSFSPSEATFLANILKAGSLPAPVTIIEKRSVDPTLGADSVHSGVRAGVLGCLVVALLMFGYYLMNGLIANLALLLNVVLLPLGLIVVAGFLGLFTDAGASGSGMLLPVLTMPGIAGIALTIGMAVDANVLILERMREELALGKGFKAAINAGYDRAFSAIFDSNLTTIITAVILFLLGSGPVRGYAVTLTAGLIVSLFTAVFVTRMVYNVIATRTSDLKRLRMLQLIKPTNLDFVGKWKIAVPVSLAVILGSWAYMIYNGMHDPRRVFGVDLTGGAALTLTFNTASQPGVAEMRKAIEATNIRDATIQYQKQSEANRDYLQIKVADMKESAVVQATLASAFPAAQFKVLQEDEVGPQIGRELKRKAFWAMVWSLVAMTIYVAWRFQFGFALGALGSLFHDVLVTAGLAHLCGLQMNLTVLAALMTIIGYSVNDTIVIFDRIREDLKLVRHRSFVEVCNQAINETLSRTLLTSGLTFVTVLFLLLMGGGSIWDFSLTMFIGMITGTYSTVYIATPITLMWYRFKTPDMGQKQLAS
ncbi:MAG: protein translocase subunit SecD [bacterium]